MCVGGEGSSSLTTELLLLKVGSGSCFDPKTIVQHWGADSHGNTRHQKELHIDFKSKFSNFIPKGAAVSSCSIYEKWQKQVLCSYLIRAQPTQTVGKSSCNTTSFPCPDMSSHTRVRCDWADPDRGKIRYISQQSSSHYFHFIVFTMLTSSELQNDELMYHEPTLCFVLKPQTEEVRWVERIHWCTLHWRLSNHKHGACKKVEGPWEN